jgi:hypothetical protein
MRVWGKTKGEHIGWRNYKEWKAKCKNADIPDAPEASFRRWKKKEMAAFDCEPTKDTAESAPIQTAWMAEHGNIDDFVASWERQEHVPLMPLAPEVLHVTDAEKIWHER